MTVLISCALMTRSILARLVSLLYPGHVSFWGLLIPIRREFDQYVNLRPGRLFEGVPPSIGWEKTRGYRFLRGSGKTEGEYSAVGGIQYEGTEHEIVTQQSIFTRRGTDRKFLSMPLN
ncbi:MAG: hypothetical protein Ct9H300mP28_23180 [Pseudomonadota bacterium]|nr:MAG: hypothetical protein Ct9H300mP28_23180 [Pseudomonadota bacterium]